MRSRKSWKIVLLALLMFPMVGRSAPVRTLEELQSILSAHPTVRGSFRQTRTLEMFSQPLISEGQFLLAENRGLQWKQTTPFSVSLVLSSDRLSQQFGDQSAHVMQAEENPMMFHFSRLFLSIFRGETAGISEQFDIKFIPSSADCEPWALELNPKKGPLRAAFKTITLKGDAYINEIRLVESGGDVSEIVFSEQRSLPVDLTEEERSAFEF